MSFSGKTKQMVGAAGEVCGADDLMAVVSSQNKQALTVGKGRGGPVQEEEEER